MAKKIEAIIREEKLNDVKDALRSIGIVGMNFSEVRGHGRQGGIVLTGRTGTYQIDLLPRVQVNIVLSEHNLEKTIQTIREAARGEESDAGDGLIFVYPVEDVIRIRTGERGQNALSYDDDIDSRLAKYYASPASRKKLPGQDVEGESGEKVADAPKKRRKLFSKE
ncbi:MAG TPA: P-II family nitrogen regulator [Candidatus Anoxymicrobiaceae bacterium]|jgi:nitrogen regulatory protein P-II 1